jgi:hypothetical protein
LFSGIQLLSGCFSRFLQTLICHVLEHSSNQCFALSVQIPHFQSPSF